MKHESAEIMANRIILDTGRRIKNLRLQSRLNQTDFERLSGVTQQQVSKMEIGAYGTNHFLIAVIKLARFFELSPAELLFGEQEIPHEALRIAHAWQEAPEKTKMNVLLQLWPESSISHSLR